MNKLNNNQQQPLVPELRQSHTECGKATICVVIRTPTSLSQYTQDNSATVLFKENKIKLPGWLYPRIHTFHQQRYHPIGGRNLYDY